MIKKSYQYIIMFAILITVVVYEFYYASPDSYFFQRKFFKTEYLGFVEKVYIDYYNHANLVIECKSLTETNKRFKFYTPNRNQDIFHLVSASDTLIKRANSNKIEIKGWNKDTAIVYNLLYSPQ